MERRKFIQIAGLSAFAVSTSGFTLINQDGKFTTDSPTSTDMLGPFYRAGAPWRNDITYPDNPKEIPLNVIGRVFASDGKTMLEDVEIDIWHCDHRQNYDMKSSEFKCRCKIKTDDKGVYQFKTFIPPPYAGRPKHIHYLVHEVDNHQKLVTQLYFKGDKKIKRNNWVKYPWDERRILNIYENKEEIAEVKLDLYLSAK